MDSVTDYTGKIKEKTDNDDLALWGVFLFKK